MLTFIKERFTQPGHTTYTRLQDLLFKAATTTCYNSDLQSFYGDDFDKQRLDTQLQMLATFYANKDKPSIKEIVEDLKSKSSVEQTYFSEVMKLVKLILVMPATNAVSKRSASALHCIKTYLRASMTQLRMNKYLQFTSKVLIS